MGALGSSVCAMREGVVCEEQGNQLGRRRELRDIEIW